MNIFENIRNALGSINSNKLRSGLTMLGVIIGITSVVLLVAIGQGAQRSITSQIQSLGTNLLTVSAGSPTQTNVRFGGGGGGAASSTLPATDADDIRASVTGISAIEPELRGGNSQLIYSNQNTSANIIGTVPEYLTVRNAEVQYGTFLSAANIVNKDKVAVIGTEVLTTLFPNEPDPLGKDFRIGNNIFTVIGVMKSKGGQGPANQDDVVFIPLTTMQQRVAGKEVLSSISVSVAKSEDMTRVQQIITAVLLNSHGITDDKKQDFTVLNQADAVQTLSAVTGTFTLLLGGIAAISLLVGGIGVMNIMLVSVTERTREIGIRKAIGAKKRDILLQFLIESTVLGVLGGLIGIAISFVGSWIMKAQFSLDATIEPSYVLLAFAFSAGVGIFFGMLPAYKAAKLRPIEALRYE